MSALTEAELKAFAELDASLPDDPASRLSGRVVADLLRVTAPEVDDVTLGRIAVAMMQHLRAGQRAAERITEATGMPLHETASAALEAGVRQLACAALTLTELEWKEPPR